MSRTLYTPEHRRLIAVLADLRKNAGLTQAELAERLDRPQSFVSKYEAGQRRLDLVEVEAIAVALGTTLARVVRQYESAVK